MQTHITGKNGHDPKLLEACQRVIDRDRIKRTRRGNETNFGSVHSAAEMAQIYEAYKAMTTDEKLPGGVRASASAVVKRVENELGIVEAIHRRAAFASREPQVERLA